MAKFLTQKDLELALEDVVTQLESERGKALVLQRKCFA